ncbi:MAG: ATP-dependent zinc metalloprotease FtsH [Patescibacteria group bacterium]|nr:ATP-dependent zinc metalloprotease FtsH [Patescibacteria group bacterium]
MPPLVNPGNGRSKPQKNAQNGGKGMKSGRGGKGGPFMAPRWNFINIVATVILVFLLISGIYAEYAGQTQSPPAVPLSAIAEGIKHGDIKSLTIQDATITADYSDGSVRSAQSEPNAALTDSLARFGVTPAELASTTVTVAQPSSLLFWTEQIAPFLVPLVLLLFFIWIISRQMRGAGMAALSFGQSKARITLPEDQKQKITFKNVAGAKEAKQELMEIVDFLKNPKKFIDIGAEIPKGVILMGAPGTGKCITGDSMVMTNKGPMRMDEIPKYFAVDGLNQAHGVKIVSYDPISMRFREDRASHWYDLGEQDTKRLVMENGATIEGTPEHPIVTVDKSTGCLAFKKLGELEAGDYAAMAMGSGCWGANRAVEPDMAYMLGILVGDGCLTVKNRVVVTTADPEVLDRVQNASNRYFGEPFAKTASRPYDYELRSATAKRQLVALGLSETYAEFKRVPKTIMSAPEPVVRLFLKGLFDADGYVDRNGSVGLSSASKELVEEVEALLMNMGIAARKYHRKKKYNGKLQYYIAIYGDFVGAYRDLIGFEVPRKAEALNALCLKQRNTNINVIPHQSRLIRSVWTESLGYTTQILDRAFYSQPLYKNVKRYMNGDRQPSVSGMNRFISGVTDLSPKIILSPDLSSLGKLSSGRFYFSKIKDISEGWAKVYDLTVPGLHNFVANGFINHNTLLARAVAGEAGVAFFSISGSEFVEMFVGVGASRVRDLFKMAKETAPAIVFVDEIDAVGRARGGGFGGGNDEREQTLNQILVEMDGFEPNEKVIVMAATNRPDVLDPALLRPGRFDRRVVIDLPDRGDREEIMKIHVSKKQLAEDVNLKVVAERTPGFSGADLASLANEAAILAAREGRQKIGQFDFIRSIEKVMLGPERKSHVLSPHEKEITAYHEAGHAIISSVLPHADPVHKISIISRGRAAGYTLKLPFEDRKLQSRKEFLDDIAVSLGGYVAEMMMFDDITTGASNDLQVSTALARDMVTRYGMSDKIGPVALESAQGRTMFGMGVGDKEYSDEMAGKIDSEVNRIMTEARAKAEKTLAAHKPAFEAVAKTLVEKETIEREEYEQLLAVNGIIVKKEKKVA